ncbi:hypothetical protein D3C81_2307020 [compost metagenome]
MDWPRAERIVTVGLGAGPLPVVFAVSRQRAPVAVAVRVAVPRLSGPLVVATVTLMLLPVALEVVPARSQV